MEKFNISIIAPEVFPVPPVKGGAVETWIEQSAQQDAQNRICILGIADASLPQSECQQNRVYRRYILSMFDRLRLSSYKLPFKQSHSFLYWRFYANWCARQCRLNQSEIIHIHNRWQFVPVVRQLNPKAKIILHFHQLSALNFTGKQAQVLRRAVDSYATCSRFMAKEIQQRLDVSGEFVDVIRCGVDTDTLKPIPAGEREELRRKYQIHKEKVILYAGRLAENKGARIIIEAFVKMKRPDTKLIVAGGTTYSDDTQTEYIRGLKEIVQQSLADVEFTGYIPYEKLLDYYRLADIIVMPSLVEEALGMSLIEGMSAGCAPVISQRGGMPELVEDNVNGCVVAVAGNSDEWAQKLNLLLGNSNLLATFGNNSRHKVESEYSWQKVGESLGRVYSKVRQRTRVTFVETGSGFGGTGKYLYDLLSRISLAQIKPSVIYSGEGNFIEKIKCMPICSERVNLNYKTVSIPLLSYFHFFMWEVFIGLSKATKIRDLLRQEGTDVVYLNNEILSHIPTILAAKLANCRIICHNHGHRPLTSIEKWIARFIDRFICVSHSTGRMTRESLMNASISVVHNGLDMADYKPERISVSPTIQKNNGVVKVGMFGRIVEWKGQEDFIRAAGEVVKNNKDVRFYIIGDDLTKEKIFLRKLRALSEQLGLKNRIEFTGWVDNPLSYIKGLDFVVQPSKQPEPFGFTVVESMALEKPVIGSRQGALPEIIDEGKNGLLFEPNNYIDLSEKMLMLIGQKDLAQEMGRAARQKVSDCFLIERAVTEIEKIILN